MSYIKGKYTTEIFSNSDNGYTVGVIKIIDTDVVELKNKSTAYFVGTFIDLKLKMETYQYVRRAAAASESAFAM